MVALPQGPDFVIGVSRGLLSRLLALVIVVAIIAYAGQIVLVGFAGVLLAIILRGFAHQLERLLPFISTRWSYAVVLCLLSGFTVALAYALGPRVVTEAHDIVKAIPQSVAHLREALDKYRWGADLTRAVERSMHNQTLSGWATSLASASAQMLLNLLVIVVIAIFVGANPDVYRRGVLYLVPADRRAKATELVNAVVSVVRRWLLGQMIPMGALGIGTLAGLWLLGIPLAFTLGLLTGLMLFIPYAGAVIAFIPTVLIAFTQSPAAALYVTILYLGVHLAEGYVITPLAQRHEVHLPPALTLMSQAFMWQIAGLLGVLVATPLAAMVLVLVQKLYGEKGTQQAADRAHAG